LGLGKAEQAPKATTSNCIFACLDCKVQDLMQTFLAFALFFIFSEMLVVKGFIRFVRIPRSDVVVRGAIQRLLATTDGSTNDDKKPEKTGFGSTQKDKDVLKGLTDEEFEKLVPDARLLEEDVDALVDQLKSEMMNYLGKKDRGSDPIILLPENDKFRVEQMNTLQSSGWKLVQGRDAIQKQFEFKNFEYAFRFMICVAADADRLDHHPEWTNIYNKVNVILTTHDCKGLSRLDFQLANIMEAESIRLVAESSKDKEAYSLEDMQISDSPAKAAKKE
jgi:4a-hydroxytetrahydrobiopterin dehydratase